MKAADLQGKDIPELEKELESLLKEQFNLRMQQGSGQIVKPHDFGRVRKDIARVKTVMTQKNQAGA